MLAGCLLPAQCHQARHRCAMARATAVWDSSPFPSLQADEIDYEMTGPVTG